jgi:uncharacterized caspase-like protein/ankyrin repeat protein
LTEPSIGTSINIDETFEKFSKCKATFKLMLVDACRTNPFSDKSGDDASALQMLNDPPRGSMLLQRCTTGEISREDDEFQHGVFIHYLIEGLDGKAADRDGKVMLLGLVSYVTEQTQRRVVNKFRDRQRPRLRGEITDFVLVGGDDKPPFDWRAAIAAMNIPEPYPKGTDPKPNTTLSEAIEANNIEQVRRHISHGTPLNEPGKNGVVPPIFQALGLSSKGDYNYVPDNPERPEIFIMLVRAGAEINIWSRGDEGVFLLNSIIHCNNWDSVFVPYLIDLGVNLNESDKDKSRNITSGITPLVTAAQAGNERLFKILVDAGAKLDVTEWFYGGTLLFYAVEGGNQSLCRYLIDQGAEVDATNGKYGCTPLPVSAALFAQDETLKGLLVSIEKYEIKPLGFAENDIKKFATLLMTRYNGIAEACIDSPQDERSGNAPMRAVMNKIETWCKSLTDEDIAVLYLAGHGVKDADGKLYLAMINFDRKNFTTTAIPLQWIRGQFGNAKGKHKLLLIDTCFSGTSKSFDIEQVSAAESGKVFADLKDIVVIASSREDEQSFLWRDAKHSLFTYWVIEAFKGHADSNNDRVLTCGEIVEFLEKNVTQVA